MSVLFQCFTALEKLKTFLSKAYLCKSHENVNFKLFVKTLKETNNQNPRKRFAITN